MGGHRRGCAGTDAEAPARHQADVDAPCVVPVDDHDSVVGCSAEGSNDAVVEGLEARAVLGLDHAKQVGVQRDDRAGGVLHCDGVDRLVAEFEALGPVHASVGDHLDTAGLWAAEKDASVASQGRVRASVRAFEAELGQERDHPHLLRDAVDCAPEQRIQFCESNQDRIALHTVIEVHGDWPIEEVLDVIGGETHGDPRTDVGSTAGHRYPQLNCPKLNLLRAVDYLAKALPSSTSPADQLQLLQRAIVGWRGVDADAW